MKTFTFSKQQAVGEICERHLDAAFSDKFEIRKASEADQKRGIDRFFRRKEKSDKEWTAVEYKADWRAGETGHFFLEEVHSDAVAGWVQSTAADWLVLFIPWTGQVVFVEPYKLRAAAEKAGWKTGWCSNGRYKTKGLLAPIGEVAKLGKTMLIGRLERG